MILACALIYTISVFAAPPSTAYAPGETLTPNCDPGSTRCTVEMATLSPTQGGTGLSIYTIGDILYASGTSTLSRLQIGSDGQVLTLSSGLPMWVSPSTGTSTATSSATYSAGTGITLTGSVFSINPSQIDLSLLGGNLPVSKGGTGQTSFTEGTLLYASGSTTLASFANGSNNQVLQMVAGAPTWVATSSLGISGGGGGGTTYSAGHGLSLSGTTFSVDESDITQSLFSHAAIGGTLPVAKGGTGQTSYTTGDLLYATSSTGLSALPIGASGRVLSSVGGVPTWVATSSVGFTDTNTTYTAGFGLNLTGTSFSVDESALSLANMTGVVGVTHGGTGLSSAGSNGTVLSIVSGSPAWIATSTLGLGSGSLATITLSGDVSGSGTTAITTTIGAGKVTNVMLFGSIAASKLVGTDIATLGTITAGTWNGDIIGSAYGGAGTVSGILKANGSGTVSAAQSGTDYEVPLSFTTPLSRAANTISVNTSYAIPLLASSTNWNSFYNTPSSRITAGTNLSWSGNTLNAAFDDSQIGAYISASSTIAHAAGGATGNVLSWNGTAWTSVATSTLGIANSIAWSAITGTPTSVSGYGITNGSALDSLAAVSSNGLLTRTASGTYAARTIVGTSNRVDVTNGNGVSGNPTIDISTSYVGQSSITTLGTVTTGTWNGTTVAAGYGGTGQSSYSAGDMLYATGASALGKITAGASSTILWMGAGNTPSWTATSSLGYAASSQIGAGTAGQFPYYASNGSTLSATSTIYLGTTGKIGVGSTTPSELFSVGGTAAIIHLKGASAAPTASAGAALTLGSGGTVTVRGTDMAGEVTFTLGSGGILGIGALITVTFNSAYTTAPFVVITPSNSSAANLPLGLTALNAYVTTTTSGFTVTGVGVALSGAATYKWNYVVIQ